MIGEHSEFYFVILLAIMEVFIDQFRSHLNSKVRNKLVYNVHVSSMWDFLLLFIFIFLFYQEKEFFLNWMFLWIYIVIIYHFLSDSRANLVLEYFR